MKQKDNFRIAERYMYEYKRNIAGLKVLREDLRVAQVSVDVKAQNYQYTFNFTGEVSNPVEARMVHIEAIESRIHRLERITEPITRLMEDLTAPEVLKYSENNMLMEILKLMYFGKNPPDTIIEELKIARRTFFRQRRELVNMAISYLAL